MPKIIEFNDESLKISYEYIKTGRLVAFPTETVYGLGAGIFTASGLEKIFKAKKRPKTDPLIVHVASIEQIYPLVILNAAQKEIFEILANEFSPGPVSYVLPKSKCIPDIVTNRLDYVGVRVPNHPEALKFLEYVKEPIAAPSANRFSHVSPTHSSHVAEDLFEEADLVILDSKIGCTLGIESTVLKINELGDVLILRLGAIGSIEISRLLDKYKKNNTVKVIYRKIKNMDDELPQESPGQGLTHYSPDIETYLYLNKNITDEKLITLFTEAELAQTVFIDFFNKNKKFENKFIKYINISEHEDTIMACQNIFSVLRIAEKITNAKYIMISNDISDSSSLNLALKERIYRSASGKFASFD